jgi:hypothetical protein
VRYNGRILCARVAPALKVGRLTCKADNLTAICEPTV